MRARFLPSSQVPPSQSAYRLLTVCARAQPLISSSIYTHFPDDLVQFPGFKYHPCADCFQTDIVNPEFNPELICSLTFKYLSSPQTCSSHHFPLISDGNLIHPVPQAKHPGVLLTLPPLPIPNPSPTLTPPTSTSTVLVQTTM